MKFLKATIIATFVLIIGSCSEQNTKKEVLNNSSLKSADLIIHSATIYLVDSSFSTVQAIAIKDGVILDFGSSDYINNNYDAKQSIDGDGNAIYPGFIDAHCHFVGYGLSQQQVDLSGTSSFQEVLDRIQEFAIDGPYWITGRGWDHTDWPDKEYPTKEELDQLFPDRPVAVRRVDGHALLANQKALDLAGINANSVFTGGTIEISEDGNLTGILIDEPANYLINKIPVPDSLQIASAIKIAQDSCVAVGLTGFHDLGLSTSDVEVMQALYDNDEFVMYGCMYLSDTVEFAHHNQGPSNYEDHIIINGFKFYADGALGSRGACLLKPYSDVLNKSHFGKMLRSKAYYMKWFKKVYDAGYQICTHCIGDSANRMILNIYSEILGENNDRRWRIEHAQVIHPKDFGIFNQFNIIPSVQPTHATSDMKWSLKRLGRIRITGAYAYRQLLEENGWIPLGTDFPVESISPIKTFYAAVSRRQLNEHLLEPFQIENGLNRRQALLGMTYWAAKAGFQENKLGRLEKGYVANLTMLDQDIMTIDEHKIPETKVLMTVIDGRIVFQRN